jgi:hypothetical protein
LRCQIFPWRADLCRGTYCRSQECHTQD